MESLNFITNMALSANSQFPSIVLWDNVLEYRKFYFQILCNLSCQIEVYQCNSTTPTTTFSDITIYNYDNVNQTIVFEGQITGSQISFILKNYLNENQSNLYFSVIYK